jgi:hypothetical protein
MDYKQMTSPCGLDCFNCAVHQANENQELRAMISKRLGVPLEKASCQGCRNENGTIGCLNMTEPCKVYGCIQDKGLDFCHECKDFPCDHLHPYADMAAERPHNTKVFNLCLIKKMGLESWAETKAAQVKETYFKHKLSL